MSFSITTAHVQQYTANVMHLAQQKGSKFRSAVKEKPNVTGDTAYIDQIGQVTAKEKTERHGDTPLMSTPHSRRALSPKDYEWADLIDEEDEVRTLIDPESTYAQAAAWGLGRAFDADFMTAYFGTARTGKTGTTNVNFDTNNEVAVDFKFGGGGAASSLTVDKLIEAKRILFSHEVDEDEKIFCAISSTELASLLNEQKVTSKDYGFAALVTGKAPPILGINFIMYEKLPLSGGDNRCPVWAQSGMGVGIWRDVVGRITERPDKSYATQVYFKATWGFTRVEEDRCASVLCDV